MGLQRCLEACRGQIWPDLLWFSVAQEMRVGSLGREDPLEKEMLTQSSILSWEIPWTGKSGGLQFMGSQRIGHG